MYIDGTCPVLFGMQILLGDLPYMALRIYTLCIIAWVLTGEWALVWVVSYPDPTPKRGKEVWWIWTVSLVWPAWWACTDTAVVKQILDLIGHACGCAQMKDSNLYSRQSRFTYLQLASHMTTLKLQSHWSAQIPFPGPRTVSKFTRPLSLLEGGVWGQDHCLGYYEFNIKFSPVSVQPSFVQ